MNATWLVVDSPATTIPHEVLPEESLKMRSDVVIKSTSSEESLLGVKFSYFEQFIADHGGREAFLGKTTAEINEKVLAPLYAGQMSVCQQLHSQGSSYVGKPTWFISHAWSYNFLDVIEAVELTLRRKEGDDKYRDVVVWFDQFTLVHPAPPSLPYETLHDTFMTSTERIGKMILVFDRWDNPLHLTRAWCVFEAYACLATNSVLEVALTKDENDRFLEAIKYDYTTFYKMLTQINTSKSVARFDDDREKIHRAIREKIDGGFTSLDRRIFAELEKWMIHLLQGQIQEAKDDNEKADWQRALGDVLIESGKYDEAESLHLEALNASRRVLGDEHPSTLVSIGNLAFLYKTLGRYDEAEPLFLETLNNRRRVLGDEHPSTLVSINNLAGLYESQGRYDEAEPLYLEASNASRRVLGDEHPSTLASIGNLAGLYESQDRFDEAEPLYVEALNANRRVLGNDHPKTLTSINDLAVLYRNTGKYDAAIQMYTEVLSSAQRTLGADHPDTAVYQNGLGFTYYKQGRYDVAEPLLASSLEMGRRTLGSSHPVVLTRIERLADLLEAVGQTDRAQRLRDEL